MASKLKPFNAAMLPALPPDASKFNMETCLRLATRMRTRGLAADAVPVASVAVKGHEELLGSAHEKTLIAKSELGLALLDNGDVKQAAIILKEVHDMNRRRNGTKAAVALTSQSNWGVAQRANGELEAAQYNLYQAMEGFKSLHGDMHPVTINAMANCAAVMLEAGNGMGADGMMRAAMTNSASLFQEGGPDHPRTLLYANNLGVICELTGRDMEAEFHYRKACTGFTTSFGGDHPHTQKVVKNLSGMLTARGRAAEAAKITNIKPNPAGMHNGGWASTGVIYQGSGLPGHLMPEVKLAGGMASICGERAKPGAAEMAEDKEGAVEPGTQSCAAWDRESLLEVYAKSAGASNLVESMEADLAAAFGEVTVTPTPAQEMKMQGRASGPKKKPASATSYPGSEAVRREKPTSATSYPGSEAVRREKPTRRAGYAVAERRRARSDIQHV